MNDTPSVTPGNCKVEIVVRGPIGSGKVGMAVAVAGRRARAVRPEPARPDRPRDPRVRLDVPGL